MLELPSLRRVTANYTAVDALMEMHVPRNEWGKIFAFLVGLLALRYFRGVNRCVAPRVKYPRHTCAFSAMYMCARRRGTSLDFIASNVSSPDQTNPDIHAIPSILVFTYQVNLLAPTRELTPKERILLLNVENTIRLHPSSEVRFYDDEGCARLLRELGIVHWPSDWRSVFPAHPAMRTWTSCGRAGRGRFAFQLAREVLRARASGCVQGGHLPLRRAAHARRVLLRCGHARQVLQRSPAASRGIGCGSRPRHCDGPLESTPAGLMYGRSFVPRRLCSRSKRPGSPATSPLSSSPCWCERYALSTASTA